MTRIPTEDLIFTDVRHLPIVKQFAKQIGLVATVDAIVDTQMELSPGVCVLAIVLDSRVVSAPTIQSELGASSQITGIPDMDEAKMIAIVLPDQ